MWPDYTGVCLVVISGLTTHTSIFFVMSGLTTQASVFVCSSCLLVASMLYTFDSVKHVHTHMHTHKVHTHTHTYTHTHTGEGLGPAPKHLELTAAVRGKQRPRLQPMVRAANLSSVVYYILLLY